MFIIIFFTNLLFLMIFEFIFMKILTNRYFKNDFVSICK